MSDAALIKLVEQYLDDTESLSAEELTALLDALKNSPALADDLKDQLITDQLLAGVLAVPRRHFPDQVAQRIHDQQGIEAFGDRVIAGITTSSRGRPSWSRGWLRGARKARTAAGRKAWRLAGVCAAACILAGLLLFGYSRGRTAVRPSDVPVVMKAPAETADAPQVTTVLPQRETPPGITPVLPEDLPEDRFENRRANHPPVIDPGNPDPSSWHAARKPVPADAGTPVPAVSMPDPAPAPEAPVPPPVPPAALVKFELVRGEVTAYSASVSAAVAAVPDRPVAAGQTIRVDGIEGYASLRFDDNTLVEIMGDAVVVNEPGPGKQFRVTHGYMRAEVTPQETPLAIITPQLEVRAIGTAFAVTAFDGTTRTLVDDGRVECTWTRDQRKTLITAGQYAQATNAGCFGGRPVSDLNLLPDPGFEKGGGSWRQYSGGGRMVSEGARSGRKALQLLAYGRTGSKRYCEVKVTPGEVYEASAWFRNPGGVADEMYFGAYLMRRTGQTPDDLKTAVGTAKYIASPAILQNEDWVRISKVFEVPADTAAILFVMYACRPADGPDNGAEFDDLFLMKIR